MTRKRDESLCQTICWSLALLAGLLIAVATSGPLPVLIAVILGIAMAFGMGVLMQRLICGLAFDHWGPFEGLKGVPGWDADEPQNRPAAPTKSRATAASAPAAAPDQPSEAQTAAN